MIDGNGNRFPRTPASSYLLDDCQHTIGLDGVPLPVANTTTTTATTSTTASTSGSVTVIDSVASGVSVSLDKNIFNDPNLTILHERQKHYGDDGDNGYDDDNVYDNANDDANDYSNDDAIDHDISLPAAAVAEVVSDCEIDCDCKSYQGSDVDSDSGDDCLLGLSDSNLTSESEESDSESVSDHDNTTTSKSRSAMEVSDDVYAEDDDDEDDFSADVAYCISDEKFSERMMLSDVTTCLSFK